MCSLSLLFSNAEEENNVNVFFSLFSCVFVYRLSAVKTNWLSYMKWINKCSSAEKATPTDWMSFFNSLKASCWYHSLADLFFIQSNWREETKNVDAMMMNAKRFFRRSHWWTQKRSSSPSIKQIFVLEERCEVSFQNSLIATTFDAIRNTLNYWIQQRNSHHTLKINEKANEQHKHNCPYTISCHKNDDWTRYSLAQNDTSLSRRISPWDWWEGREGCVTEIDVDPRDKPTKHQRTASPGSNSTDGNIYWYSPRTGHSDHSHHFCFCLHEDRPESTVDPRFDVFFKLRKDQADE